MLIRLLFHLGCRVSEALALTVEDVDLGHSTITIKHLKERIKLSCPNCGARLSKNHTYCPGCSRKVGEAIREKFERSRRRILPVDRETLKTLQEYIERGGPVNRNGRLTIFGINRHRAWQIIKECAKRTGLPLLINPETGKRHNISPHRLKVISMPLKFILRKESHTTLHISQQMHLAVKLYAQKEGITITEATNRLLTAGLKVEFFKK